MRAARSARAVEHLSNFEAGLPSGWLPHRFLDEEEKRMQKMKRRQDKELEQMMAFELKMQEIQTERDKRAELEKRKGRGRNQTAFEARFSFARGAVLLHISATILAIVSGR